MLHYDHVKIVVCDIFVNTVYEPLGENKSQTLTLCRPHIWAYKSLIANLEVKYRTVRHRHFLELFGSPVEKNLVKLIQRLW